MSNISSRIVARFVVGFGLAVLYAAIISSNYAKSFDDVLAPVRQAPEKCHSVEGIHAWAFQARALYDKPGLPTKLGLEPVGKTAESFKCGKHKSTVYLYSYSNPPAAEKAMSGIKRYIWGRAHRSIWHLEGPEIIFASDDIVVVVSGKRPKSLAALLAPRK